MEDSEAELTKLVQQLARRVPGVELDPDVVASQIAAFRAAEAEILKKIGKPGGVPETEIENPVAKLAEEMKSLPSRVAERLVDFDDRFTRRRRMRRLHPMMFEEVMHMGDPNDPISILLAASIVRDDAPWLYELASEVYRVAKSGTPQQIEKEIRRLQNVAEMLSRGSFLEEFGFGDKESYIMLREFPRVLYHMLERAKSLAPRRAVRPKSTRVTKIKAPAA